MSEFWFLCIKKLDLCVSGPKQLFIPALVIKGKVATP